VPLSRRASDDWCGSRHPCLRTPSPRSALTLSSRSVAPGRLPRRDRRPLQDRLLRRRDPPLSLPRRRPSSGPARALQSLPARALRGRDAQALGSGGAGAGCPGAQGDCRARSRTDRSEAGAETGASPLLTSAYLAVLRRGASRSPPSPSPFTSLCYSVDSARTPSEHLTAHGRTASSLRSVTWRKHGRSLARRLPTTSDVRCAPDRQRIPLSLVSERPTSG